MVEERGTGRIAGGPPRRSDIAYVLIRLRAEGRDCLLLHRHAKWGDWSLVGGHVEADEQGDWSAAAAREAEEELVPWRLGRDFAIESLGVELRWGPAPSRSAGGQSTEYRVAYFLLRFADDPRPLLAMLPGTEFRLVTIESLERDPELAVPIRAILKHLGPDLAGVPSSWNDELSDLAFG